MQIRCLRFLLYLVAINATDVAGARAHTTTLAITGDSVPEVDGATWNELAAVTLNNDGALAFIGSLQHSGAIDATNDTGVWLFDTHGQTLLARTGIAGVPEIADAEFSLLSSAALSDSGDAIVAGSLADGVGGVSASNNRGIWRYDVGGGSIIARTGSGDVPGVATADFASFPSPATPTEFALASNGGLAMVGTMVIDGGAVFNDNDRGIWTYNEGGSALVAREGSLNVPGIAGANFSSFPPVAINSANQVAAFAVLKTGGGVSASNATGIWSFTDSGDHLLARAGVGNVPDVVGGNFQLFDPPRINDTGDVVFRAALQDGTQGVWQYDATDGSNGSALALSSAGGVPGIAGANFATFEVNAVNDSGQVLVNSELEIDVGGVTAGDDRGLWLLGGNALIARVGVGNVPGIEDAAFASFSSAAPNSVGQVAFTGDLEVGIGAVDNTNDSGLWLIDPLGESQLVAREGDALAGHTIAELSLASDGISQTSGFNDNGEIAFRATFANGDSGLFLFRSLAADFDRDGDVDGDDLAEWQLAFAATAGADADTDGDSDGADFLAWQRTFGAGVIEPLATAPIPEPASVLLMLTCLTFCLPRMRRVVGARSAPYS